MGVPPLAGGTTVFQAFLSAGANRIAFDVPLLLPANTAGQVVVRPGGGTTITAVQAGTVIPFPYFAPQG